MNKHVLFLTSTNLACNPRCLKEVRLLYGKNITITVVAFNLHNWTTKKEILLNEELKDIHFHYLETSRRNFFSWLFSSMLERCSRLIAKLSSNNIFFPAMAVSKRSWLLLQWVKKAKIKPDLIIAHNPPAFYAAYKFAQKLNVPFAIDVEDYHPGEGNSKAEKLSVSVLMHRLLNKAVYASFASPLIKKYTEDLISSDNPLCFFTINNTFSQSEFTKPVAPIQNEKLQLVWFSQFIDYERGLEKILPALDLFAEHLTLTLIGTTRKFFFDTELQHRKYIYCKPPLSQKELNQSLSNYDIGLAIEDKTVDLNRNLCLTNKIWSYFQSGLYILASDTDAQKLFLKQHKENGIFTSLNVSAITESITQVLKNKKEIRSKKEMRFNKAMAYSWENESKILTGKWQEILR